MTVYRNLVRHGLVEVRKRSRRRDDYKRWERDAPMALWQLDIVGGVFLADGTEVKVVTGVDGHSRFCTSPRRVCGLPAAPCAWPWRGPCSATGSRRGPGRHSTANSSRPVRSGWRSVVRSDLPGLRDRAPPDPARHPDHHGQDRAMPPDPAPTPTQRPWTFRRPRRPDPTWWDLRFLAFGAILTTAGLTLWRSDRADTPAARRTGGRVRTPARSPRWADVPSAQGGSPCLRAYGLVTICLMQTATWPLTR
jgi:hypothetical protein